MDISSCCFCHLPHAISIIINFNCMSTKNCLKCGSFWLKNGRQNRRQRYLCRACGHSFQSSRHLIKRQHQLWNQYVFKRQTLADLADSFNLSTKHIRRELKRVPFKVPLVIVSEISQPVALVCDTTYFGCYGVMVWRCFNRRSNLLWHLWLKKV